MKQNSNFNMKGGMMIKQHIVSARDSDSDGIVDGTESLAQRASEYAENLATQLRKGFLAYCVLVICADQPKYTSDILRTLHDAELVVVEGTIYPLLSRLQKDGLLDYNWQESEQGPPRKYYGLTPYGAAIATLLQQHNAALAKTLKTLEKGAKL